MSTRLLIVLCAIYLPISCYSQDNRKAEKQYDRAMELFYTENFDLARIEFEEIYITRPTYRDVEYRRELTYFLDGDHNRSLDKLLEFQNTVASNDKFYHYWLGRVFLTKYMFDEAIGSWTRFLNKDVYKTKEIRQETNDFIKSTETLSTFFENNADYVVTLLPETINTPYSELNPAFSDDNQELIYTTSRIIDEKEVFEIRGTKLLSVDSDEIYDFGEPYAIESLNSVEYNNTRFCLTYLEEDIETLIAKNNGALYSSKLTSSGWNLAQPALKEVKLPKLGPDFTVSRKQDRIIFSSTKGYKKNGYDLYEIQFNNSTNKWSKPVPITELNSSLDETSPFLSFDQKTLYFSSNGHNAIGGFDIFYSKWNERLSMWNEPVQMNYPINTPDDDVHFKLAKDGASGYFSSNRVFSRGDFDIFHFRIVPKSKIKGKILLASTEEPVPEVQIIFLPSQYVSERYSTSSDANGAFEMQLISDEVYRVQVKRGGVLEVEDTLTIGGKTTQELNFLLGDSTESGIDLVEVITPEESTILASQGTARTTEIRLTEKEIAERRKRGYKLVRQNIYFNSGGIRATRETNNVLAQAVKLLNARKDLQVEIGGHTDNLGDALENLRLSYERAEMVKSRLMNMGIVEDRLTIKAYGESTPLSSNDDEEDGRELNRRVEIRVIGSSL